MRAWLLIIPCCLLQGCGLLDFIPESTPSAVPIAKVYKAEPIDGHDIRRVAVLPFSDRTGSPEEAERIMAAFTSALREAGDFDVVLLPRDALELREEEAFARDATLNHETLLALHRRYNVDAVIFGTITHFRSYSPLLFGVKLAMFSAGAGDVIWEVDALFDARKEDVVRDVHNYHDKVLADSGSLEDYRIILMSPSQFMEYACARIAETWRGD